jgi:hypothetical protein
MGGGVATPALQSEKAGYMSVHRGLQLHAVAPCALAAPTLEKLMYRMFKTLPCLGAASALALTLACNSAPNTPTAPGATAPGGTEAAPDGSTLKVVAPSPISPTGDTRLSNRVPTMTAGNSTGKFANTAYNYEFQLLTDGGQLVRAASIAGGSGTTTWVYPEELARDTAYKWQVRATLNGAVGPWSPQARFFTVKENRTPNPTSGRLPIPSYGASVVSQVASQRPDLLARSCQDHGGTWEFMDLLVDTLRLQDTRWGYNGKRGNANDPSQDIVAYNYGSRPDEGTTDVYIIDVMLSHCGSPSPAWIDQTDITIRSGTIGRWTSRGRFAGSSGVR